MEKTEIQKRISKEQKRLLKIFSGLDPNKLAVCKTLIARAAFLTVSLEDLEEQLQISGWVDEYTNGANQSGLKRSVAADVHIALTKNLNAIEKQLLELVPAAARKSKLEELRGE